MGIFSIIYPKEDLMVDKWDECQEIFDQCISLKAVELDTVHYAENFRRDVLPTLSATLQEIWKSRFAYFEKRGIQIANLHEIGNNFFRKHLVKKEGLTWGLNFY